MAEAALRSSSELGQGLAGMAGAHRCPSRPYGTVVQEAYCAGVEPSCWGQPAVPFLCTMSLLYDVSPLKLCTHFLSHLILAACLAHRLVQTFPAASEKPKFITVLTRASHWMEAVVTSIFSMSRAKLCICRLPQCKLLRLPIALIVLMKSPPPVRLPAPSASGRGTELGFRQQPSTNWWRNIAFF
jgi:hypothetical protein